MIDIDLETDHAGEVSKLRWNASRQSIVVHQAVDYHHCIIYQVQCIQDLQVLHRLDSKKSEFDTKNIPNEQLLKFSAMSRAY